VRGPNHENICAISQEERVPERQAAGAANIQTATDYLVESMADPNAYVVENFSAAMPKVFQPPISLTPDEIMAVITYMQAQGCEPDPAAIILPAEVLTAAAEGDQAEAPFSLVVEGDPASGRNLFYDDNSPAACGKCHTVAGEGASVGPDLTDLAATQTLAYIFEAILAPSASIAGGYEPILIQQSNGEQLSGVIDSEDDTTLVIKDKDGAVHEIAKADIARERRYPDEPSVMPANFGDLLTVQQISDLIAFLQESAGVLPVEE
jgi:putative heme-binding domain-containing protein